METGGIIEASFDNTTVFEEVSASGYIDIIIYIYSNCSYHYSKWLAHHNFQLHACIKIQTWTL